jgi:Domain of unknown function (DUF4349)
MRLRNRPEAIDPDVAEALDAIDATVAGEPVDARYAELAEVALLLGSDRPLVSPEFARSMDERVGRRFAPAPPAPTPSGAAGAAGAAGAVTPGGRGRRWPGAWPAMGALATGVALIATIAIVSGGGGGSSSAASSRAGAGPRTASGAPSSAPGRRAAVVPPRAAVPGSKAASGSAAAALPPSSSGSSFGGDSAGGLVQPPTTGRKVVQSAQLNLTAAPNRIDAVAQEVYDVIGEVNGVVDSSTVTQGGPGGYASFQLSVPSATLAQTMSRLSQLDYATVVSRTDNSQDITGQFDTSTRALADARALRTSLLKQLANATTTAQVDSLTAQIHDAEASISSDEATLARLNNQVDLSEINVTINASVPPPPVSHGGGFTLGQAAHDAARVLTVAAGVALIAIAALTPVALLVALAWWVGSGLRRRRRQQALDLV